MVLPFYKSFNALKAANNGPVPKFVHCHRIAETLKNNPMTESTQSSLIHLGKVFATILICALQVLLFLQFMPYGGLYIGLLSLTLDLALYCWLVSGAYKALSAPPKRKKNLTAR